ncbi:MAG: hypothetical protein M3Q58_09825 [Bacteroidota bacterium]|nr:hypothetical protein [Bacteroidota bacterium]
MKKAVAILGYISTCLIITGSLFKIQHWPGAGPMLVFGTMIFAFGFLTVYLIWRINTRENNFDLMETVGTVFILWFLSIGVLFKLQHWPGAGPILVLGSTLFIMVFLPILIIGFVKKKDNNKSINILGICVAISGITMVMAMNVSKDVLISYVNNNEAMVETHVNLKIINQSLVSNIHDEQSKQEALKIQNLSEDMFLMIENYKQHIIRATDKLEYIDGENIPLTHVDAKDNYDVPTYILVGSEPAVPKQGEFSANELKLALIHYADQLSINLTEEKKIIIIDSFSFPDSYQYGVVLPWETAVFDHMPLVSVITTLSALQTKVLSAGSFALIEVGNNKTR